MLALRHKTHRDVARNVARTERILFLKRMLTYFYVCHFGVRFVRETYAVIFCGHF